MERTAEEVGFHVVLRSTRLKTRLLAIACEVLARRIVHLAEPDKIRTIMSTRYKHRQVDGDESEMASALEMAIDQHWCVFYLTRQFVVDVSFPSSTIFLSSTEAQDGESITLLQVRPG